MFCFRFIAHFCDEDRLTAEETESKIAGRRTDEPVTARGWILEYGPWLLILVVLTVLCFAPIALIFSSFSRLFP